MKKINTSFEGIRVVVDDTDGVTSDPESIMNFAYNESFLAEQGCSEICTAFKRAENQE
jgi:hypothetical protein